jgi:hypothetical protein
VFNGSKADAQPMSVMGGKRTFRAEPHPAKIGSPIGGGLSYWHDLAVPGSSVQ